MPYKDLEKRREKNREYVRKYQEVNREEINKRARQRYADDIENIRRKNREKMKIWRVNNPEKHNESCNRYHRKYRKQLREKALKIYGIECFLKDELCGGKLTIDHINGHFDSGVPDNRKCWETFFRWLIKEKRAGFVTLCHNHNSLKGGLPPYLMIRYAEKLQELL